MDFPGLYLHIPFCTSKCFYCDFASGNYPAETVARYLEALQWELSCLPDILNTRGVQEGYLTNRPFDTLFWGGGTPSRMEISDFLALSEQLRKCVTWALQPEITLEANPESLTPAKLAAYREQGVNRISLGAQSFLDSELERLGRIHRTRDTLQAVEMIRQSGIPRLNLDLICALPGQNWNDWKKTLQLACRLAPDHLSVYLLEIHPGTEFHKLYGDSAPPALLHRSALALPDEERISQIYLATIDFLAGEGFQQYEISNFAKPGAECRHNLKYWRREPVLGAGCSAWSFVDNRRWGNLRPIERYIDAIRNCREAVSEVSLLSSREILEEMIFLGLRLKSGLCLKEFKDQSGLDLKKQGVSTIERLMEAGLLEMCADALRLTPRGCLLSNEVFAELISDADLFPEDLD
jgi:oxygen-independent coproporphyrinogen III oxidase